MDIFYTTTLIGSALCWMPRVLRATRGVVVVVVVMAGRS